MLARRPGDTRLQFFTFFETMDRHGCEIHPRKREIRRPDRRVRACRRCRGADCERDERVEKRCDRERPDRTVNNWRRTRGIPRAVRFRGDYQNATDEGTDRRSIVLCNWRVVAHIMDGVLNQTTNKVHKYEPDSSDFRTPCGATARVSHDELRLISIERLVDDSTVTKCRQCFEDGY